MAVICDMIISLSSLDIVAVWLADSLGSSEFFRCLIVTGGVQFECHFDEVLDLTLNKKFLEDSLGLSVVTGGVQEDCHF